MKRALSAVVRLGSKQGLLTVLAVLMALTVLVPAQAWRAPAFDIVSEQFDPVTMYTTVSARPGGLGDVTVDPQLLTITSLQGSKSLVHLVTTPMSYSSQVSFRVNRADAATTPLTVAVTSPYLQNELRLVLGGSPARAIVAERVVDGLPVEQTVVGVYALDVTYDVEVALDRDARTVELTVAPRGARSPIQAVHLSDDGTPFAARIITVDPVAVAASTEYLLSADVLATVTGMVGVSIEWLDTNEERISVDAAWAHADQGSGTWSGYEVQAVAPPGAAFARPEVALDKGASGSVTDVRLTPLGSAPVNLVINGTFGEGTAGWRRTGGAAALQVRQYPAASVTVTASGADFPELFGALRMALTVTGEAGDGVAQVELTDFRLEVPHQRWMAVRVDDPLLKSIVAVLGLAGCLALVALGVRRRARRTPRAGPWRPRVLMLSVSTATVVGAAAVVLYGVISLYLAHQGSMNVDIIGARVWAYTAGTQGLDEVYFLPNVSSAEAGQWQGHALQEAGFPYGPTMAYIFGALGALYGHGLHQPALAETDAASIDLAVRLTNGAFGLVAAVLIGLIVRGLAVKVRSATIVAGVFLLAPALAFSNSVWGSTQSMSLVFLLAAILLIQRTKLTGAWVLLLAAMMTRPQNLVVGVVLAMVLLRTQPVRATVHALSRAVIVVFVALLPLSLLVSPTLPMDVMANALFMHVGNGNDTWTLPVSWGAFGPWQLVVAAMEGVGGVDATLFPATVELAAGLTYYQWGTLAFLGSIGAIGVVVLVRGRRLMGGGYLVLGTLAVLALMLLKTGAPSYHMLLPTALSFLLVRALPRPAYLFSTITLSTTTMLSMYGMGAYWLSGHPQWAVGVYDPTFWPARAFAAAVDNPTVVLLAALANTLVLVTLAYYAVRDPQVSPDAGAYGAGHRTAPTSAEEPVVAPAPDRVDVRGGVLSGTE